MTMWWLVLILSFILCGGLAFIYIVVQLHKSKVIVKPVENYDGRTEADVEHIFNEEFRQELRNRGRLHFEKILGENAMFLQQDLRLTTSQLNDYMKNQISKDLKEAFANYQGAITDAKQLAVESIEKTKATIDEQRRTLSSQLEKEVADEKIRRLRRFDENTAEIINHYVLAAIGNQIDLNDQLEYIFGELEAHKKEIIQDITNGA